MEKRRRGELTGTSGLGDQGLAGIAVDENGRSLDVVQVLTGEWVRTVTKRIIESISKHSASTKQTL